MRDADFAQAALDRAGDQLASLVRKYRFESDARREEIIDAAYCDLGFSREQFLQVVEDDARRRETAATRAMIHDLELDGTL